MISASAEAPPVPMSLTPSNRITVRTPGLVKTSWTSLVRPLRPTPSLRTWLAEIPSLVTASRRDGGRARSRSARRSGHRWLAFSVEPTPEVIESPRAATVETVLGAVTTTASSQNHTADCVGNDVPDSSAAWSPVVDL